MPGLLGNGGECKADNAEVVAPDLEVAAIVRGCEGCEVEEGFEGPADAAADFEEDAWAWGSVEWARKAARKLEKKGRVDCWVGIVEGGGEVGKGSSLMG